MNPTHKFSKVLFCIRDFQITLKSGLSLAKSLVFRYQLENKSIRHTLINFFSKCINRENHQPFDHSLSLSLSLSLSIYIYIYTLQKKIGESTAAFCKSKEQQKKRQCNLQQIRHIFTRKKNISILPTNFSNTHSNHLSIIFSILLKQVLVTCARHVCDSLHQINNIICYATSDTEI